jgi:3-hydroxyacyl-CoA dehydrogenase
MGDDVLLLEFHSKMNALDADIFKIMQVAIEKLHGDATGLVIGNEGPHFCAGANVWSWPLPHRQANGARSKR